MTEVGLTRQSRVRKLAAIRRMLKKYGDIPEHVVKESTRPETAHQWVAVFDNQGNVLSAGRVEQTDWYLWSVKNLFTVPDARGKGLATSVTKKLVQKAIKGGAKVVAADVTVGNTPSKKILLKLGFHVVSTFKWSKKSPPANILHFVLYPGKSKMPKKPVKRTKAKTTKIWSVGSGSSMALKKVKFKW